MKFTIIPDDKTIIVDGLGYNNLQFKIDGNIHAIQWYGEFGEIEYKPEMNSDGVRKPLNKSFTDYKKFEKVLSAWHKANEAAQGVQNVD